MITTGTTPAAPRFTTGIHTTEEEASAAELAVTVAALAASAADLGPVATQGTGRRMGMSAGAAGSSTVPALRLTLLVVTTKLLEDTPNLAVSPAPARAPSAATIMADKPGPIRHAAAPAWVAEERVGAEEGAVAVAGIGNQRFIKLQKEREI